jgi:hypothetical protein
VTRGPRPFVVLTDEERGARRAELVAQSRALLDRGVRVRQRSEDTLARTGRLLNDSSKLLDRTPVVRGARDRSGYEAYLARRGRR